MSTTAIILIIVAIVVIAIVAVAIGVRARRRRQHPHHGMGLPELGALSSDGLDKAHAAGPAHHNERS